MVKHAGKIKFKISSRILYLQGNTQAYLHGRYGLQWAQPKDSEESDILKNKRNGQVNEYFVEQSGRVPVSCIGVMSPIRTNSTTRTFARVRANGADADYWI